MSAHHGNNYLPLLERYYRSHRSALFTLLDTIELEATSADRSVLDAVEFIRANRSRTGESIPEEVSVERIDEHGTTTKVTLTIDDEFAGESWRKVLRDKDHPGRLVRRHLEGCARSPTSPPSCAPGTSPWSAQTQTSYEAARQPSQLSVPG